MTADIELGQHSSQQENSKMAISDLLNRRVRAHADDEDEEVSEASSSASAGPEDEQDGDDSEADSDGDEDPDEGSEDVSSHVYDHPVKQC